MSDLFRDLLPVAAALAGSLGTGVLALLAVRINTRATRSNRVWDARREGYTAVLTCLKKASEKASIVDHGYNSGEYGPGSHDYFNSPSRPEAEGAFWNTWQRCRSALDASWLILSDDFLARSEHMLAALPTKYDTDSPPDQAARRAQALHEGHRDLLTIARREFASRRV